MGIQVDDDDDEGGEGGEGEGGADGGVDCERDRRRRRRLVGSAFGCRARILEQNLAEVARGLLK